MRAVIDIGATAKQHADFADFAGQLLAAHALTGCDTVAFMWGKQKQLKCFYQTHSLTHSLSLLPRGRGDGTSNNG